MATDDGRPRLSRRRVLAASVAAGLGLAGCSSDSPDEPPENETADQSPEQESETESDLESESETVQNATPVATITDVTVSPTTVRQFQPAEFAVTVANEGTAALEARVSVDIDGSFADAFDVTLAADESTELTGELERQRVGEHTIAVAVELYDGPVQAQQQRTITVKHYPAHQVTADGMQLACGDGRAVYGGASLANAFARENNRPSEASLEPAFDTLADLGVSSARIWGFAPSWADMSSMPGPETYNDQWFEYFDRVVVAAKKRDIRLFVPLFNGNPAYGPVSEENLSVNVPQFVRWADDAETRNDFFESEECMQMYKGWVKRLVTHENHLTGVEYRNDPTIAMWELGNEIQHSPPRVGESIRPWFEEAGAFVKELDDQTLLTTGSYGHQGRNAFVDEANAEPIDVVSIHYYPGPEHYDLPEEDVIPTLESTIQTVREKIGKPLYVGEYNWGVGPEDSAPYTERAEWVSRLQRVMREGEVAATNFHIVADESRPTSFHKKATVYAPYEEQTLDKIATHARLTRDMSDSECL
jgi:mannan endo-1,4-beta-mannosidase